MSYALVGTIGTAVSGTGTQSPAFGQTPTAGNLLICWVIDIGSGTISPPSGWTQAESNNPPGSDARIFFKIAAGGDAAPSFAGGTDFTAAQLAEYSGNASSSPLDQIGSASGTGTPLTATQGGVDAASGELLVMAGADPRSANRTSSDTWTSNNGTVTQAGSNNGTSTANHFTFGYLLSTTSNASADTAVMTLSNTQSIVQGHNIVCASFKLPAAVALPELTTEPLTPSRWHRY